MKQKYGTPLSSAGLESTLDPSLLTVPSQPVQILTGPLYRETSIRIISMRFGKANSSLSGTVVGPAKECVPLVRITENARGTVSTTGMVTNQPRWSVTKANWNRATE